MSGFFGVRADEEQSKAGLQKQGISSVFPCPCRSNPIESAFPLPSRRRAPSVDMSSEIRCEQNVLQSDHLRHKEEEEKEEELENPGQFDIWNSILSQKAKGKENDGSSLAPTTPYVHPLVKRSASSLSEKSLEICTESLGSETGSDGFSSYPPSETNSDTEDYHTVKVREEEADRHEEEEEEHEVKPHRFHPTRCTYEEEIRAVKYKKSAAMARAFPPPLPSLSHQMVTRRENSRLVLDAISVPSQNCFDAHRHNGRLVLSFANAPSSHEEDFNEEESEDDVEESNEKSEEENVRKEEELGGGLESDRSEEEEEEEEESEMIEFGIVADRFCKPSPVSGGFINLHRSAIPMKNLMGFANTKILNWPPKFNQVVLKFEDDEDSSAATTVTNKSLPPCPRVAQLIPSPAESFNTYEHRWRSKTENTTAVLNCIAQNPPPLKHRHNHNNNNDDDNSLTLSKNPNPLGTNKARLLLLRGNRAEYFVPLLRGGCKEEPKTRRSILIWEPYCGIATSS